MRSAYPETTFGLHLHNTYGMGLANVAAGLDQGIRSSMPRSADRRLPVRPGGGGNIATEDVVFMLESMGVETGIDLVRLAEAGAVLRAALDSPLESAVSRALGWVA